MPTLPTAPDITLAHARPDRRVGAFCSLETGLGTRVADGTLLAELRLPGRRAEVEWLYPFSWDHGDRGVHAARRTLHPGDRICLHAGPYGTADAVAHRDGVGMRFPGGGDGHRYRPDSAPAPGPHEEHQDAAAWVLVRVGPRCLVLTWEYSGHLTTTVEVGDGEVVITGLLPVDTFAPHDSTRRGGGPVGWAAAVPGDLDAGATALRSLITTEMITAPDLSGTPGQPGFPCVVANSWGLQEDISDERIVAMMDATAAAGAEVFVVDKGWERAVGDWHPGPRFPTGLRVLADLARERGLGFGVWCGWGNADPRAPVARQHPEWLATWRGQVPALSFDNHALCLGHDPARDWVLAELTRMVDELALTWTLHDFETIARCDSPAHTHDPGAGEHAAEAAFHHILGTLRERFPQLVLENCWNGVRPLDLAMIRSHHTTITEDHCRTHPNSVAKVGLGRYLPLDWQSAYMGADDLPDRARMAPYVIGGPWVLMEDAERWSAQARADVARAVAVFKRWRGPLRDAVISRPPTSPATVDSVLARAADGRILLAVSSPPGVDRVRLVLDPTGVVRVVDEWTGDVVSSPPADGPWELAVDPAGDGLILALLPG